MNSSVSIQETNEFWIITPDYAVVKYWLIDYAIRLQIYDRFDNPSIVASLNDEFILRFDDQIIVVDSDIQIQKTKNRFKDKQLLSATIYKDGNLTLVFNEGMTVTVAPVPSFEAWWFSVSSEESWICLPGGGIA